MGSKRSGVVCELRTDPPTGKAIAIVGDEDRWHFGVEDRIVGPKRKVGVFDLTTEFFDRCTPNFQAVLRIGNKQTEPPVRN